MITTNIFLLLILWLTTAYAGCGIDVGCWINEVANKAAEITRLNEARKLLEDTLTNELADQVYELLKEPLEDVTKIYDLLTNPFEVASLDDDVLSLGNTLSVCITDLTNAVFGDLPFPDLLEAVDILDVDFDAIIFELAAIPLLPIKSQIEFVCIDVLDLLTAAISGTKDIPLSRRRTIDERRRFLYENDCEKDEGLCKPTAVPYNEWSVQYDDLVGTASNVLSIYLTLAGCFTDTSESNYWQTSCSPTTEFIWQTIEFILEELQEHLTNGCELVAGCAADVQSGCQPKVQCSKGLAVTKYALKVVKKILWAIGFHNGEIAGAKRAALYMDRFNIIHNQHALKQFYKTEIDAQSGLITNGFNTLTDSTRNDINSLQIYLKTEIDAQSGLITTRFNTLADNVKRNITHTLNIMNARFNTLTDVLTNHITNVIERMDTEFTESTTNINNRFQIELNTLRNGILGTQNALESNANEEKYILEQIQNSIDALQAAFDGQYSGSSAKGAIKNMAIDRARKYEEEGLIVFRIKAADLCIFGALFVGLNMMFMVIGHFLLMKCCYGHHLGFTPVPKYDYSTSDIEEINK